MTLSDAKLIVVVPIYEDAEAGSLLFKELAQQFGHDVFVVAVDDGSIRQPLEIDSLENAGLEGAILHLKRNVGHQRAIAVGLAYVSEAVQPGQQVVMMDSDGEDIPSTIPRLLKELASEHVDVAVARRNRRMETFRFRAFYAAYKQLFGLLTGRRISFGNFMALKAHSVKRLVAMPELSIHVAGAVLASKLRTAVCLLDRGPRYSGQSKMNFVGLVLHGFKGLMVFAEDVLVRVGVACAITASLSVVGIGATVILRLIGHSTPGWFSIALGILVLMFLQTGALTLMTLLLTGIIRSEAITSAAAYREFVERVVKTSKQPATA
jgi:hypothetical protein